MTHPHSTPAAVSIRRAAPADLPDIMEIERQSFVHAGEQFSEKRVHHLISSRRILATVAEVNGRVLAWAVGMEWRRGQTPWGRIFALAVHPDARGKRLGAQLLQDMTDILRRRGAGPIYLEVRPDNHIAIRLYCQFGFAKCAMLEDFYGTGLPAMRMVQAP